MLENLDWDTVKEFYKESFGIDGWVVEMYANLDILTLCASGASNESISNFLEIPKDEVKKVLKETFEFDGWEEDLPLNPYKLYTDGIKEYPNHVESRLISEFRKTFQTERYIYVAYWICRTLDDIERKIQDEWI